MKGIVFTEFLEMVEKEFGIDTAEALIDETNPESGGVYTAVGTYSHTEVVEMVKVLSAKTGAPLNELIKAFGKYLHTQFEKKYTDFFKDHDSFSFLKSVDGYIHKEVKKLYSDAELPVFTYEEPDENTLIMNYTSSRPFADLAEGMFLRNIEYYKENIVVEVLDEDRGSMTSRTFRLKKVA